MPASWPLNISAAFPWVNQSMARPGSPFNSTTTSPPPPPPPPASSTATTNNTSASNEHTQTIDDDLDLD
jgi:hypothetical protein